MIVTIKPSVCEVSLKAMDCAVIHVVAGQIHYVASWVGAPRRTKNEPRSLCLVTAAVVAIG